MEELLKRPEVSYESLASVDPERPLLSRDITEQVEIQIRYAGYIEKQNAQVEKFKKLENKKIPEDIDYEAVGNLRTEAVQKLSRIRPASVGQASRISGVSPADISVLIIYLEQRRRHAAERKV